MLKKFLLAMLIVVSLPLASLWYTNGIKLQNDLELRVNENLAQTATHLASEIDDWTEMNVRLLKHISSLDQVVSGEQSQQKPILESMTANYEWLYLAYAIGRDGYKTARSDDKPILNEDGTKAHFRGDRKYFKQIRAGSSIGQQLVLSRTLNKPAFILCHNLSNPSTLYRSDGALCIGSTVEKLSKAVVNTKIGNTGYAVLLDDSNKVIAHGDSSALKEQLQDFSQNPMVAGAIPDRNYTYESDGVQKVAYMKRVGRGWKLITTQDYDDAYSALFQAKINSLILFFVTITLSVGISYFMAKILAAPIQRLTEIANEISQGKFNNSITETTRSDEIGELAKAIEKMSISISMALKKLKSI